MIDSLAHGVLGLAGASAAARGTPDSLTWFARSRAGGGGAFLAGGRFVRRTDSAGGVVRRLGLDSLAVHLPRGVWVLERPVGLPVTASPVAVRHPAAQRGHGS